MTEPEGLSTPFTDEPTSFAEQLIREFGGLGFVGNPMNLPRQGSFEPTSTTSRMASYAPNDPSIPTDPLDTRRSSFAGTSSDHTTASRSLNDPALAAAAGTAAAGATSATNWTGANPEHMTSDSVPVHSDSATNKSDDERSIGTSSTIETSNKTVEINRLRKELLNAHAKIAHMTQHDPKGKGPATLYDSAFCHQVGHGISADVKDRFPTEQNMDFDSVSRPSDRQSTCGSMNDNGLMEGSMPDYGSISKDVQMPFMAQPGPGVIGQQYNRGVQRVAPVHNFVATPAPFSHAGQEMHRHDSHGCTYKQPYIKENMPWGFGPNGTAFESVGPSRSATPIHSNMGSLPASLAGSTVSLPLVHQQFSAMGPRAQTASALSPMAAEFSSLPTTNYVRQSPWNAQPREEPMQRYMTMSETPNYRQMLDRNFTGPYKQFVDRIVYSNDQQSSIALQHKLKVGTAQQKYEVIQAIIEQGQPLMVNRFGNFLVQRCFEHGTPEQVSAICRAIRGHTLNLSMDAFGCHVVQKAFDYAPEEYKALMVHELLCNITETVIHRYACHVWQKLFELNWNGSPPQIMKYVNEALRGMWHEVALGETGSLVVQNIFENCLEEDKRPCINEVLASIDVIAHGQFGNWCIQHICEHGAPADQTRAIDHILRFATEYSIDQYASKVVEKCLKICGSDFLDRYLERVCESRPDRPRMPLIDIAGDQYGNYLVQYILQSADPHRREIVASHLRKHTVSLRGSKYGSRVAMLCINAGHHPRSNTSFGGLDRAPGAGHPPYAGPSSWENRPPRYNRGFDRSMERSSSDRSFDRTYGRDFSRFDRGFDY